MTLHSELFHKNMQPPTTKIHFIFAPGAWTILAQIVRPACGLVSNPPANSNLS